MTPETPDEVLRERDALRQEVRSLAEQLKHLVRAEHALTRSRRDGERQLERIKRLADFAFDIAGVEAPRAVLDEAREALVDQFQLDDARVLTVDFRRPEVKLGNQATSLDEPAWKQLIDLGRPVVAPADALVAQTAIHALRALGVVVTAEVKSVVLVPLRPSAASDAALLTAWTSRATAHHRDVPTAEHQPFLELFGNHITRALDSAHFTSELRRQREALSETNTQLQNSMVDLDRTQRQLMQAQKLEAIGRLAGGIAHDFNNLLTVIISHADLAREAVANLPDVQEDLSVVVDAATRATEITRRLLAFGRKQEHHQQVVDINVVATDLSRMLRRLIGDHIVLQLDLDPSVGRIKADAIQLEQILLNLVVNARDAMPKGGKLTIETRRAKHTDRAAAEGIPTANLIALSVRDTGVGMDENTRRQLFEPFFTTKPVGKGTGLGLATVYGLVKQNHGEIVVNSTEGRGSCFTVLLPSADGVSRVAQETAPEKRGSVLVVEDEDAIRRMVSRVLRKVGFEVTEARDGEEALAAARKISKVDLLVTDVVMPNMGGAQLVHGLRGMMPDLKVIFMSGHTFDHLKVGELNPQVETFLAKPFTPDQLNDVVNRALKEAPRGRAAAAQAQLPA